MLCIIQRILSVDFQISQFCTRGLVDTSCKGNEYHYGQTHMTRVTWCCIKAAAAVVDCYILLVELLSIFCVGLHCPLSEIQN